MNGPGHVGHEYCGVVVEVGSEVKTVRPGRFVVSSFCISDNTCPHCKFGFPSSCEQREFMSGAQAPYARVPLADGTLVPTAEMPSDDLIPSLFATSDVLGTGGYAADAARVQPGSTVAVVGDGAVELMGVLSAKQMGAVRVTIMTRHKSRQQLALEYGAIELPKLAIDSARHAAELDDRDPWAHLALGYVAFVQRQTAEAVAQFRQAIEL
jgi:threonine dehydrogenase-like Zn-dependent dehydrogenase